MSSGAATTSASAHWDFFQLPPFFTLQPSTVSLERQKVLWADVILDHAAYYASTASSSKDTCTVLRVYTTKSDIFYNPIIKRRLPPSAAKVMFEAAVTLHPNQCALLTDRSDGSTHDSKVALLVSCTTGGLKGVEQSLLSWILEQGSSTTTATDLAKNGVVLTFDELVEGKALYYKSSSQMKRLCSAPVLISDVGALDEESAIRMLLQALNNRPVSLLRPYRVTLFNMDGSDNEPYEGVKIGGGN